MQKSIVVSEIFVQEARNGSQIVFEDWREILAGEVVEEFESKIEG